MLFEDDFRDFVSAHRPAARRPSALISALILFVAAPTAASAQSAVSSGSPQWKLESASRDPGRRQSAAEQLSEAATDPRALPVLLTLLNDTDDGVRWSAVYSSEYFSGVANAIVVDALLERLTDQDSSVRTKTADVLAAIGDERCYEALSQVAAGRDLYAAERAIASVVSIVKRTRRPAPEILVVLKHAESGNRRELLTALGKLGHLAGFSAEALADNLTDPDSTIRLQAATALEAVLPFVRDTPSQLIRASAFEEDEKVRIRAIAALGQSRWSADAVDALLQSMKAAQSSVRLQAIRSYGVLTRAVPSSTGPLIPLTLDPDSDIRLAAVAALAESESLTEESRSAALRLLKDSDSGVRSEAAHFFALFATAGEEQMSALAPLLDDSSAGARSSALSALTEMARYSQTHRVTLPKEARESVASIIIKQLSTEPLSIHSSNQIRLLGLILPANNVDWCDAILRASRSTILMTEGITALGHIVSSEDFNYLEQGECPSRIATILTELAGSGIAAIRTTTATALARLHSMQTNDSWASTALALLPLLASDPIRAVRAEAVAALDARIDDPLSIDIAKRVLKGNDQELRTQIVRALAGLDFGAYKLEVLGGIRTTRYQPRPEESLDALKQASSRLEVVDLVVEIGRHTPTPQVVLTLESLLNGVGRLRTAVAEGDFSADVVPLALATEDRSNLTLKNGIEFCVSLIPRSQGELRRNAIATLVPHVATDEAALRTLMDLSNDPDPSIRGLIVRALGAAVQFDERALKIVKGALADADPIVQSQAILALEAIVELDKETQTILVASATAQSEAVSSAAVAVLLRTDFEQGLFRVLTVGRADDQRIAALRKLAESEPPVVQRALSTAIADPSRSVRLAAIDTLRDVPDVSDELVSRLTSNPAASFRSDGDSPDSRFRERWASVLGRVSKSSDLSLSLLNSLLTDDDEDVRLAAAVGVAELGRRAGALVPALSRLLVDANPQLRSAAARGLAAAHGNDPRIQKLLFARLKADPELTRVLLLAIGAFSPPPTAIGTLVTYLKDGDVSTEAIAALEAVGPSALGALITASSEAAGEQKEALSEAVHRLQKRIKPEVLSVDLPTGGKSRLVVDDNTVVFRVATWCHYSVELIEYLGSAKVAPYLKGIKLVFVFEDEWPTIQAEVRAQMKEKGNWSEQAELRRMTELRAAAKGALVFDPDILKAVPGRAIVARSIEGHPIDSFPLVFLNDTGRFSDRHEWPGTAWFSRRIGMPAWLLGPLDDGGLSRFFHTLR